MTSQEEFEEWVGSPYMLRKSDSPALWGASKNTVKAWEDNPYEHPHTRGAYEAWKYLKGKANEPL